MRIYAAADVHGRKKRLRLISEKVKTLTPDVLVLAGDITTYLVPEPDVNQLKALSVPTVFVRGNWDSKKAEKLFGNSALHLSTTHINGVSFIGVGGAISIPFYSRIALNETPIFRYIESQLNNESILVVHPPPRRVLDTVGGGFHAGCSGLYDLIIRSQPKLVICGHIHECPGTALIGDTTIVNCSMGKSGAGAIIEYETGKTPIVKILEN